MNPTLNRAISELQKIPTSYEKNSRKNKRFDLDREYLKQLEETLQQNATKGDVVLR